MYDEDWVNDLYFDEKVKTLTTQTRLIKEHREGVVRPIDYSNEFTINDLFNLDALTVLPFLNETSFKKIIKCFEKEFYGSDTRYFKIIDNNFQVRIASSYKTVNKFYDSWKVKNGTDINNIFPRLSVNSNYGILISNYPVGHELNTHNFCGIKVFKCGLPKYVKRLSITKSFSMYENELNNNSLE